MKMPASSGSSVQWTCALEYLNYFLYFVTQEMCCGWINFTDWYISNFTNGEHKVPDSCCKEQSENCGEKADTNNNIYKVVCVNSTVPNFKVIF